MPHLRPVYWSDALSVGLKSVDDEHKVLLSIYNDMVTALRTGPDMEALRRVVTEFRGYVRYHFAHEEDLMAFHRCPSLAVHRKEHLRLTERLSVLADGMLQDRLNIPSLLDFAEALVHGHFMTTDRQMAETLRPLIPVDAEESGFQDRE